MYVWGRNNNHLFKQNHKKTYSLPQRVPLNRSVVKCAPGYDFVFLLSRQPGPLICYYQSAFYQINFFESKVIDVATTDNMVVVITTQGSAWIMQFNADKIIKGETNPSKINLKEKCLSVSMNHGDIFLQTESSSIYHLKRNEWYQTKTFSDPIKVEGLQNANIMQIVPAFNYNYFLSAEGDLFINSKSDPAKAAPANISLKLKAIAASDYFVGVGQNGRLYIWGKYNEQDFDHPTQFGKITQTFKTIHLSAQNGFAVTTSGQAWVWGKNANGQLGISDYEPRPKPFPLITMVKDKIKDIYIGQGYTVCIVQSSQHNNQRFVNYAVKDRQEIYQKNSHPKQKVLNSKNKVKDQSTQVQQRMSVFKNKKKQLSNQYSSLQMRYNQKISKQKQKNDRLKGGVTQIVRKSEAKSKNNKNTQKTPQKSFDKTINRSKSPVSNNSHSKSPVSRYYTKSPYMQHVKNKSSSNLLKNRTFNDTRYLQKPNLSPNKVKQYKIIISELQDQINRLTGLISQKQIQSKIQYRDLQQENVKLKKIVQIKQNIIEDITTKIRLLEDAIEQHERTLTARDNMMEQYQKRQKEYQIHIDELQKNIQILITGKSNPQERSQDCYNQMYKNLKMQFFKQKDYFMQKMTQYQQMLKNQRTHYKLKIKNLEDQIHSYRSQKQNQANMLSSRNKNVNFLEERQQSRNNKQNIIKSKQPDEKSVKMNFIISRIEDSKVRIAKSATKVYEMMDEKS